MTAIFNFLMIAGAIQGFVFNVATFLSRKKIEKPVLFLNLFVFFLSLNNLQSWLIDKALLPSNFFLDHFTIPWNILIVPMFYAFLVFFLGIEKRRYPFLITSLLLFVLALMVKTIIILGVYEQQFDDSMIKTYNLIEDAIALAYSIFLFVKSIRLLYKYQQLYPDVLKFDNLRWIKRFLQLGGIVFLFWIIAVLFNTFSSTFNPPYTYYPLRLSSSILIYWVGYQGFFRYVVLKDRIGLRASLRKTVETGRFETSNSNLSGRTNKSENTFKRIDDFITVNKRYLDSNLSLEKLGEEVQMGTSSLSKLINGNFEGNFSDYINQLRVEEAKKALLNPEFNNYTIVAVGLECGFNSKSTFYTAFRKITGQTPSEFRKQAN